MTSLCRGWLCSMQGGGEVSHWHSVLPVLAVEFLSCPLHTVMTSWNHRSGWRMMAHGWRMTSRHSTAVRCWLCVGMTSTQSADGRNQLNRDRCTGTGWLCGDR